ncbi:MAG: hypothetical protein P8Z37_01420 [Acidobacteriota bacterium]
MPKRILRFFVVFNALLTMGVSLSIAGDHSLGGYLKSYFYIFQPASIEGPFGTEFDPSAEVLLSNRLRVQASYTPTARIRLEAAYDIAPRFQSASLSADSLLFGRINPFAYRAADFDSNLYPSEGEVSGHFELGQNLDRVSLSLRLPSADVIIGRQAIAWGSARVMNPTDVLAPFTFDALDTEDRIGIDAIRARIPIGILSEIDVGYVFGRDFEFRNSAFFMRAGFNTSRTDISLLLMGFRENLLLGIDMARPVGGAGVWLESAYVFSDFFNTEETSGRDYFRATAGMDYNLTGKTYGFVEYHFNGAGSTLASDYLNSFKETAYQEGSVYLLGRHYIVPGLVYQCTPLISCTIQSLINVTDPSIFLSSQLDYNIGNNIYLGLGAFIGIGENPTISGPLTTVSYRSEFGGYPNFYFASLRYYF